MGEVYLAEDPQIERKLAIKTVRLAGRPQEIEERKRRLLREARAAGRLLHPNVVTLFDAGEADGVLFLAFEFVEGTDLAGRLENGPPLSLRDVLRIIRQVADALEFAHRQGIVHRDIKPSNILIDHQKRVKVADFGIAKVTGQSTELTVAGSVMGSPQYLSPEQIRGEELDGRSDVFSLGVVLYELLSKKRPFDGDTITTLVYQILHKEPPPISELRAVPERLEQLLRRMLAKSRDERFASAAEVATEVMACERELSDETLSAPASDLPMQATRALPRRTGDPVSVAPTTPFPSAAPLASTPTPPPPPRAVVPPPPPAAARASAPAASASPVNNGPKLALAIVLVGLLVIGGAAGGAWWYFFGRGNEPQVTQAAPDPTAAPPTSPASPTSPENPAPEPASSVAAPPRAAEETPDRRPAVQPPVAPPGPAVREVTPLRSGETRPGEKRPEEQSPRVPAGQQLPVRDAEVLRPAPTPAPAPVPAKEEPEEEEEPARRGGDAGVKPDLILKTGLELAFRTTPPDAFVLVDGTPVGRATEWNGQKGNRTFSLDGAGDHRIKLRSQGLKDFHILVQASETAGVTPITARLRALPAAQAETSDLKVYRVQEAIAFRVQPPGATILVDDKPAGQASQLGGRFGQPKSWLRLTPGRHRIGVSAAGMARQDFLVEVSPGAEEERERIEVTLQPGGEG
jgi:serine/threonine-protein kinase